MQQTQDNPKSIRFYVVRLFDQIVFVTFTVQCSRLLYFIYRRHWNVSVRLEIFLNRMFLILLSKSTFCEGNGSAHFS